MFFTKSQGFTITRSPMYNIQGHQFNITDSIYGSRSESFERHPALRKEDVIPQEELFQGRGYHVHSALAGSRLVVLKVFSGPRAKKDWAATIAFNQHMMHPRLLHMVAPSQPDQDAHFIVFNGEIRGRMERLIACALRHDLTRSTILGLKTIYGISAGLSYLGDQGVPLLAVGMENFEIFIGGEDSVSISINPTGLLNIHKHGSAKSILTKRDSEIGILNVLCGNIFNAINSVLYQEQLHREEQEAYLYDPFESPPKAVHPSALSRKSLLGACPVSPNVSPRREFVWRSLKLSKQSSLLDISNQFGNFLSVLLPVHREPPLRRFWSRSDPGTAHRCHGYFREEINLSTDISRNAIVSHRTPAPQEICSICGEVVEEGEVFRCSCGGKDDPSKPNIKCTVCLTWQHLDCAVPPVAGAQYKCSKCTFKYARGTKVHPVSTVGSWDEDVQYEMDEIDDGSQGECFLDDFDHSDEDEGYYMDQADDRDEDEQYYVNDRWDEYEPFFEDEVDDMYEDERLYSDENSNGDVDEQYYSDEVDYWDHEEHSYDDDYMDEWDEQNASQEDQEDEDMRQWEADQYDNDIDIYDQYDYDYYQNGEEDEDVYSRR